MIPLEKIADGVFSAGMLGMGCGIETEKEQVYAPFDGTVILIADTKHAIGLESDFGIEILIHIGIDTVEMDGNGFEPIVKTGQHVTKGELLMEFSLEKIKAAGYRTVTALIVTNSDDFSTVKMLPADGKEVGRPLLQVATLPDLV